MRVLQIKVLFETEHRQTRRGDIDIEFYRAGYINTIDEYNPFFDGIAEVLDIEVSKGQNDGLPCSFSASLTNSEKMNLYRAICRELRQIIFQAL